MLWRALRAQQVADRAIHRHRIARRLDGAEREVAVGVGGEGAAQVHVGLRGVLVLVEAFRRCVPDVDLASATRLAVAVAHPGIDEQRPPGVGERTIDAPFSICGESSRQNGPSRLAVVSALPSPLLSRHTSAETPSEPAASTTSLCDSFVRWPSRAITCAGLAELVFAQARVAHEVVQVAHAGQQDLAHARIGRAGRLGQHGCRDVAFGGNEHVAPGMVCGCRW